MKTSLIAVGCNEYIHLDKLNGAENDAYSIYDLLVKSELSIYEEVNSIILKSPTLLEFRDSLKELLIKHDAPEVFTFFFAGHGGVFKGEYYICLKDTDCSKIGLTAISLSEVLRSITSIEIKHLNIILDACHAGGLVNDLASIIKPEIMGEKGSLSVSILNAAASNEFAQEDIESRQGLLTGKLLSLINGSEIVNSESEYLDLVSIGNLLSKKFDQEEVIVQSPSAWGLNLFTSAVFAKNPFFNPFNSVGTLGYYNISQSSRLGVVIDMYKDELSNVYDEIDNSDSSCIFLKILQRIDFEIESIDEKIVIIESIGVKFIDKAGSYNNYKQLELINALCTLLIKYLPNNKVSSLVDKLTTRFKSYCIELINNQINELKNDKLSLVARGGGHFDVLASYYYLPIKISKLFGYLSQFLLIDKTKNQEIKVLLGLIVKYYKNHLICVSDIQMPYLYTFFSIAVKIKPLHDIGKKILVEYLRDFFSTKGQVSKVDLNAKNALQFILQRNSQAKIDIKHLANPNGIGSALFLSALKYNLSNSIDCQLHHLDRLIFYIFIASDIKNFGNEVIEEGHNLVMECGYNFWECKDFEFLVQKQLINYPNVDFQAKFSCIASSFIQPNRLPLMIL